MRASIAAICALLASGLVAPELAAQTVRSGATPGVFGPFNIVVPQGGDGIDRALPPAPGGWRFGAGASWTIDGWVDPGDEDGPMAAVGGAGGVGAAAYLTVSKTCAGLWTGVALIRHCGVPLTGWHHLAATSDGTRARLFVDGREVASTVPGAGFTAAELRLAPRGLGAGFAPFGGRIMEFEAHTAALTPTEIADLARHRPDPALVTFTNASPTWPPQSKGLLGMVAPQDAWTLPRSTTPPSSPRAKPPYAGPALAQEGPARWEVKRWRLAAAPGVTAEGSALSRPGYDDARWYAATVPGTVLTTLIDRGVYPDPDYGLNNMAIPEGLARQDYWYRAAFNAPAGLPPRPRLEFDGINYAAEVWLNGERLGAIKGAFIRGRFDVTGKLHPGVNAVAVRISPPPHPGIPHEQSLAAGAGQNGGVQAMDGPTFFDTEGWDWIPGIRDRNSGLWQGVHLTGSGDLRLGDPHVVTRLIHPGDSAALVEMEVPVVNLADRPIAALVTGGFDQTSVRVPATVPPGETLVRLGRVRIDHPRLWWPNGYGEPALYTARFTVSAGGTVSDTAATRFGIREITYELSLMDPSGHLRRVEVDYAKARELGERVTDGRHAAIRKVEGGWVDSLTAEGAASPAVTPIADMRLTPFLILKVNGIHIAARGGSWGTDDMLKRIGRDRLEPFFRLHRDAGVNIIRNWVGQNTEPVFYDLADEYGMLITNDFWESTQEYQQEATDPALFLRNAADTIARYRNHPSIALWFGRNEGVPQPGLNDGLEDLVRTLDGTRWYNGSSNQIELWYSGPYNYREPADYFTKENKGFAVEVGTPSFPTLEAFEAMTPPTERWPISDTWAYHDWHQDGNGAVSTFMAAMAAKLGPATGLEDFERKAQLLEYESYRAIMEGMNAELWTKTSGRMLWMTQPAWPSTQWQILSHDYDTHAAYYGFKAAAEPIHAQLRLPDDRVQLVNNRQAPLAARITVRLFGLDGRAMGERAADLTVPPGQVATAPDLDVAAAVAGQGALVARLEAVGPGGALLSRNTYWLARDAAAMRALAAMPPQPIALSVSAPEGGAERHLTVTVTNRGSAPALNTKLTLLGPDGARILPAYYSDNYLQLLPGETRTVTIAYPAPALAGPPTVTLRGWDAVPSRAPAGP